MCEEVVLVLRAAEALIRAWGPGGLRVAEALMRAWGPNRAHLLTLGFVSLNCGAFECKPISEKGIPFA